MGGRGVRYDYLHTFTDRHGTKRYYFRRHGKRWPITGAFGSQEFKDSYAAARAASDGEDPPERKVKPKATEGSFTALAQRYFASPVYKKLAASSQINYRRVIEGFLAEHGHRLVRQMTREKVDAIIGKMADKPGAGIVLLKRIKTLINYGISIKWISVDPTLGATSYRSEEIHTWTEDEIDQFERRWLTGTRTRLAYALLLYTGQRGSDVHRMTWADIKSGIIGVVQKKTRTKLNVTILPELQAELDQAPREHVTILNTEYGQPFTVKGFGNMMSDAITAAGLPARCQAHGLRKAAARRLAEAGCTEKEIGSVTGHKSLSEIERYTRAANQEKLARSAAAKQEANKRVATLPEKFANPSDKTGTNQ